MMKGFVSKETVKKWNTEPRYQAGSLETNFPHVGIFKH